MLAVYALKTSPAFEAALLTGLRLATDHTIDHDLIRRFSRTLGVAYQTVNDLKDWQTDRFDKLLVGQDALAMRPTVLESFAHEAGVSASAGPAHEARDDRFARLRDAYDRAGVFRRAHHLVDGCRERALATAGDAQPPDVGRLLAFVARIVLS